MPRPDLTLIFVVLFNHYLLAGCVDIKLVNNLDACFGRVKVKLNSTWRKVCGESWNINAAAVVCRQLGCGRAVSAHTRALIGVSSEIWIRVRCEGSESSIIKCSSHNCSHSQEAEVVCSGSLVVIFGAVIIAVVLLLSATIIILVMMRKKRSKKMEISSRDAVAMHDVPHDVPHEDRYEDDDDDDYEKVDVDGDLEDLNSEQDYVNLDDEPTQANVESDDSEQDYVNMDSEDDYVNVESDNSKQDHINGESDHSEQDHINGESDHSEQDHINGESDNSEQDYVNVEITEDRCVIGNNYED